MLKTTLKKIICFLMIIQSIFLISCDKKDTYSAITDFEPHIFKYSNGAADYGYYDIGNCRKLTGDVYTLAIFIDDNESVWNDDARNTFYNKRFFPSVNYLKEQAEIRSISLNLQCGQYTTASDLTSHLRYNGIIETDSTKAGKNADLLSKVAKALNFPDKEVMHAFMQQNTGVEQIAYIILLNKSGRAYAVSDTTDDGRDEIEFVVAFSSTEDGRNDIGSSVIHEMLHIFGAADLYATDDKYTEREKLCKKLYPNDIMMKASADPNKLEIGRLTEFLIGWSDYFPPECDCEEWWK